MRLKNCARGTNERTRAQFYGLFKALMGTQLEKDVLASEDSNE
jgi:hypothetical protein